MKKSEFVLKCRENFLKGVYPCFEDKSNVDYKMVVHFANEIIKTNGLEEFCECFMEYQYLVNLWTAHIIIENYKPSPELARECIEIIERYSTTPLNLEIASQEKRWLDDYYNIKNHSNTI